MRKLLACAVLGVGFAGLPAFAIIAPSASIEERPADRLPTYQDVQSSDQFSPIWQTLPVATRDLLAATPGLRAHLVDGRVTALYGMPMTAGATPEEAASAFLAGHVAAFGQGAAELEQTYAGQLAHGKFTVFHYVQRIDGLPVEHGKFRVLVNNDIGNRVVFAGGTLAETTLVNDGSRAGLSAEGAVSGVQSLADYAALPVWSEPELVVFFGNGVWTTPVTAWKFVGENPILTERTKFTFFVDAVSGALLHTRDEVLHVNVTGTVSANASPGLFPDTATNLPTPLVVPDLLMSISGGSTAYSDNLGFFDISNGGSSAVTVTTNASAGRWVNVNNQSSGGEISASVSITPGVAGTVTLNTAPSQNLTAQANALIHTALIHDYFRDRSSFTNIDTQLPANVNIASTCNAFYDGASINFYLAGGGCNNTAFSSVVAHEYGHHIVNQLGLGQGGFGEGFADTVAMLLYNDNIVGRQFFTSGGAVRNPATANQQYPCSSTAVHTCGQILGGVWWETKVNFDGTYGTTDGIEFTRQLQVDWAQVTLGGQGSDFLQSAHPTTAIEVLTVNDDDGNINNGTPDYSDVCDAFGQHGIDCPEIQPIGFEYPNGLPSNITPNTLATIRVDVVNITSDPTPGTGRFVYSIDGGTPISTFMTSVGTNQYQAVVPPLTCGSALSYYFEADWSGGSVRDPLTTEYSAIVATSIDELFADTFETNLGWTIGATGDNATTGIWTRVDPNGTAAQPEDDVSSDGTLCFVTGQGSVGGGLGDNDVDGGTTTLLTPIFDLSVVEGPQVSYWRWYSNTTGAEPNADTFVIDISNNGGTTWTNVETVGPSGPETSGGWFFREFAVADFVTPTASVRLRFRASDLSGGSLVEAAIDEFRVTAANCEPVGCPNPQAGCDNSDIFPVGGDCVVDLSDLGVVLANFAPGVPGKTRDQGDVFPTGGGDGVVDLSDLGQALADFNTNCQ